ncbi:ABC transporter permease [Paenibacillus sp. GYB006]|uniref:ABC transporter permease n=1 Tax=Paenibacillus sp. GYB006 TaxID=2994394 RepID=UPI003FA7DD34
MNTVINLIKNENMKMHHQRSSTLILVTSYLLTTTVLFFQLLNDMLPFRAAADFIIYADHLFTQIFILGIVIQAVHLISSEYADGTIKLLIIRPVSRNYILFSKYVAMLLFSLKGFSIYLLLILPLTTLLLVPEQWNDGFMRISFVREIILFKIILSPFFITLAFTWGIIARDTGTSLFLSVTVTALTMNMMPIIPGLSTPISIVIWSVIYVVLMIISWERFKHQEV